MSIGKSNRSRYFTPLFSYPPASPVTINYQLTQPGCYCQSACSTTPFQRLHNPVPLPVGSGVAAFSLLGSNACSQHIHPPPSSCPGRPTHTVLVPGLWSVAQTAPLLPYKPARRPRYTTTFTIVSPLIDNRFCNPPETFFPDPVYKVPGAASQRIEKATQTKYCLP